MQQIPIYFKSDFKLFIKTEAGFAVPFKFEFYTNMPSRPYIVKYDGHEYHNCEMLEDGRLCIAFDDHGFGLGKLMIRQSYYLNDADYASEICDRVIAPQPVVNIDDNLLRSEIVLALSGDDTIEFTSQLPPYYQAGLTPEEHQALIDATVHAEEAAASANEQAGIATEAAKAADEARQALTTAYNEKVAALDADYAQKKAALEADYSGVKDALSSDYASVKAQLDADYAATKEALTTDYTTALAGLNDRMTAIESQFSADREAWNKSVADFITASQATFDGKLTDWKLQVDAAIADITRLQEKDVEQDQKLSELDKEVIAQDISFEAGAVNYLNGTLVSSGKSIRTDVIPISEDVRIIGYFNRTLYKVYIVKYLNGVYAGYEQISVSGMNIDQLFQKDTSFDSFRLRVDVTGSCPDWSAQDILDSSASIYLQNSVAGKVETLSSSVQEIENKIASTPSSLDDLLTTQGTLQLLHRMSLSYFTEIKKAYVNLDNLSVGSTFIFQTKGSSSYTYEYISVEEGDIILLTTKDNTVSAKAYAIIDAEDKVLAIHQEPVSNAVLLMPTGAKKFVTNTYTATNDYALNYIMGKTADYDSAVKQLHTFHRSEYSFISSGVYVELSNGPIPSGSIIIAVTGSDAVTSINLYDENGENRLNLPITSLPYITTRDYYKASTYISGKPLLTIVTSGILDSLDYLYQLLQKLIDPITKAIVSKKYSIANHDNDFSFDNLFVGQLVSSLLQMQRNFEVPCEGAYLSTDVENVVRLSEPVTDEQMLKANVPYLYIDGVKRGTIVLFDTDGTPFIYDNTGKKRYLTLS